MADQKLPKRRYGDRTADERLAQRRAQLVEAALDSFSRDGYRGASIEGLCAAARISTRNFYELFTDREALLLALHDDLNARALEAVALAVAQAPADELRARAHAGLTAYFSVITSDPRWARIALVDTVGVSPTAERHRQEAIGRFAALIEAEATRLAAEGRIPERDFPLIAAALVGAINGLVNTWTVTPDWAGRVDAVVDIAVHVVASALTTP